MGFIRAGFGSIGGALADTWKEEFYSVALDNDVLVVKGKKKISGRTSNINGEDNVITSGSGIIVSDGQCVIIVEQGKVVDICSEPGEYVYDNAISPSLFCGNLGKGVKDMFGVIGKRFEKGVDTGVDQRIYYFNIKEILNNKFGTIKPIPFRVVDNKINLDLDVSIRCFGTYSIKIVNPLLFYKNVCGNIEQDYKMNQIEDQLKIEFCSALQPAFGELSSLGLRPNEIVNHNGKLEQIINGVLSKNWQELRGIIVVNLSIGSVTLTDEDQEIIKQAQKAAVLKDPIMAGATLASAQADAMRMAASNDKGAVNGFMGMGLAFNKGAQNVIQNMYDMGTKNQEREWICSCGQKNIGNFCQNCGKKKI